jgi:hypothetical protein
LNRIDEIKKKDYLPTIEDIVRSRVKTTGIVEMDLNVENFKFG